MISTEKKKRGRKPKSENIITSDNNINDIIIDTKIPKKIGRKPKGGKIIENIKPSISVQEIKPNIILHLKCNSKDLDYINKNQLLESYNFSDNKINNLAYN